MVKLRKPSKLTTTFLLLLAIILLNMASGKKLRETKLSMFLQGFSSGSNATIAAVAGIKGKQWSFTQFGSVIVTDDPITQTADINSTPVGRAQGMFATAGLDGINSQVMISIVFGNKKYNGSTLEIQGISKQFDKVRELSIVSGTGIFRYGRGFATFETIFVDKTSIYSVVRCNVSVLHY